MPQYFVLELIPLSLAYVVGNEYEISDEHTFRAMKSGQDWGPRLAVYGDLGAVNARSLSRLELESDMGMYDAVLHVGESISTVSSTDLFKKNGILLYFSNKIKTIDHINLIFSGIHIHANLVTLFKEITS